MARVNIISMEIEIYAATRPPEAVARRQADLLARPRWCGDWPYGPGV